MFFVLLFLVSSFLSVHSVGLMHETVHISDLRATSIK